MQTTQPLRVRNILSSTDSLTKAALKKMLPPKLTMPAVETKPYPPAILKLFPKADQYSLLGCLAEDLLRKPAVTLETVKLCPVLRRYAPTATDGALLMASAQSTTKAFLQSVQTTRQSMEAVVKGDFQYDQVLAADFVQGHPDALTPTQVFEVKLTGYLQGNWPDFLLQTFAYASLQPSVEDVYIVLPLQETVWHHSVKDWAKRNDFRNLLNDASKTLQRNVTQELLFCATLRETHHIGCHIQKQKSLVDTVGSFQDYSRSYQIFLGNPQSSKLAITDKELAVTASLVAEVGANVYVHTPYIINLCAPPAEDNWSIDLFLKYIQYSVTMGAKGVVIHVGKSTKQPLPAAMYHMTAALKKAIAVATPECPVLLETPAGQGTETLKDIDEFINYVLSFKDDRLRICLDTCHVFACGHKPLECIQKMLVHTNLLKLVHYNDSLEACGSCLDRHAFMGSGHIGLEGMTAIAERCSSAGVPMLTE
jgi:deoxyribonuclease-4